MFIPRLIGSILLTLGVFTVCYLAHPILSQIPLIISPFLHLPKAVTLPFNFNKLPSTLPNSSVTQEAVDYIIKDSEQFSHFVSTQHEQREKQYDQWLEDVIQLDLKEKRKIAPGYLDSGNRILQPMKADLTGSKANVTDESTLQEQKDEEKFNEIDQVFGRVSLENPSHIKEDTNVNQ